jgi:type I restriction enzyme S subunit
MSIRATVGTVALLPDELDGANLTQGTARISPGPEINRLYLFHYLQSDDAQEWIRNQVKGATFREITLRRLRELPVVTPPLDIQNQFAEIVTKIEEQKDFVQKAIDESQYLFDSLMSEYSG